MEAHDDRLGIHLLPLFEVFVVEGVNVDLLQTLYIVDLVSRCAHLMHFASLGKVLLHFGGRSARK
jgi:hypothetical protein